MAALTSPPPPTDTPGLRLNRACRHCVQIKAKCIPIEGSNICVRCQRLGKQCTTPAPVLRKRRSNNSKLTRVSQLEERINTLTDLLTSKGATTDLQPYLVPTAEAAGDTLSNHVIARESITAGEGITGFPNGLWSSSLPTPPTSVAAHDGAENDARLHRQQTVAEIVNCARSCRSANTAGIRKSGRFRVILTPVLEEKLFNDFQTQLSVHFPFVVIPPQATAASLREDKPFLFRSCITIACHVDPPLLRQLADDLTRYIGDSMLLKGEKSLDLLQGLLIFLAWYQHCNHHNPQVMNVLHLAIAMAIDLGLNRPSQTAVWAPIGMIIDPAKMVHGKLVNQGVQTSDDRRALLGVYYLSGQMSSAFRRLDPMRWTQHLEDCCNALLAAAEYPSDSYAVHLVKLHRTMETYSPYLGLMKKSTVPIQTYMACVQEDLQRFQLSLPANLVEDTYMNMQIHSAFICLYETIFAVEGDIAYHRAEALHACLNQISGFFDGLDTVPSRCLPCLPFIFWLQLVHVVIVLAKLSFFVIDGWDLNFIRSSKMNFASVTDRLMARLQTVSKQGLGSGAPPASDPSAVRFSLYVEKIGLWKKWYENRLKAESESQGLGGGEPPFNISMEELFEGLDDGIWPELTGDWSTNMQF